MNRQPKPTHKIIGRALLLLGILLLILSIFLAFAVGTNAVPALLISSIVINSVAITVLRGDFGHKG